MTSRVFLLGIYNARPSALLRSPIRTVARAPVPYCALRYGLWRAPRRLAALPDTDLCAPQLGIRGLPRGRRRRRPAGRETMVRQKYRRFSLKHTEPCQNDPCLRIAAAGGEKLGFNDIVGDAAKNKRCEVRWPAKGRAVRWTFSNRRRSQALS